MHAGTRGMRHGAGWCRSKCGAVYTGARNTHRNPLRPVVKLSTIRPLARRMADIIDIDFRRIISGEKTIGANGRRSFSTS